MPDLRHPSRRRFLGMASAVATSGALLSLTATPTAAQDGVAQEAS